MIAETTTRRAIAHLTAFGDTDIFPALTELKFLRDKIDEISKLTEQLTPGNYRPSTAHEFLVPKSRKSFRIAHQLTAEDTLIFLASVLQNAPGLEASRVSPDEGVAFSYRFQEGEGPRLFRLGGSFHDWITRLSQFGGTLMENDSRIVIETDISDFYQRIYHHRIENILDSADDQVSARMTKKLIKSIRANQSFGIPVGQTASRILAEMVLNDTDNFLIQEGVAHTRYVDDFRIIVENQTVAHATLCRLAEHLMTTEGLSLNGEKTEFQDLETIRIVNNKRLNDVFNSREFREFELRLRLSYEDDPTLDEDEDDVAELVFFDGNGLADRINKFEDYGGKDLTTFKALLRAIRLAEKVDPDKLIGLPDRLLYLVPRDFCRAFTAMDKSDPQKVEAVKKYFISKLHEIPFSDLTVCRYWILDLFVKDIIPCDWNDFRNYDFSRSTSEKRCEFFIRGRLNQPHYFRAGKTRLGQLSDWERTAFLISAMCLPQDEYSRWITSSKDQIPSYFQDEFANWLKENWGKLPELLS